MMIQNEIAAAAVFSKCDEFA